MKNIEALLDNTNLNYIKLSPLGKKYMLNVNNSPVLVWLKESNLLPVSKQSKHEKWYFSFRNIDPEEKLTTYLVCIPKDGDKDIDEILVIKKEDAIKEVIESKTFQKHRRIDIRLFNNATKNKWGKYLYPIEDFLKIIMDEKKL